MRPRDDGAESRRPGSSLPTLPGGLSQTSTEGPVNEFPSSIATLASGVHPRARALTRHRKPEYVWATIRVNYRAPASGGAYVRRLMAVATLLVFAHAVALHVLHSHAVPQTGHRSQDTAISVPSDAPTDSQHSNGDCPACHLQHGFTLLEATPPILCLDVALTATARQSVPCATLRSSNESGPSRAPPVL